MKLNCKIIPKYDMNYVNLSEDEIFVIDTNADNISIDKNNNKIDIERNGNILKVTGRELGESEIYVDLSKVDTISIPTNYIPTEQELEDNFFNRKTYFYFYYIMTNLYKDKGIAVQNTFEHMRDIALSMSKSEVTASVIKNIFHSKTDEEISEAYNKIIRKYKADKRNFIFIEPENKYEMYINCAFIDMNFFGSIKTAFNLFNKELGKPIHKKIPEVIIRNMPRHISIKFNKDFTVDYDKEKFDLTLGNYPLNQTTNVTRPSTAAGFTHNFICNAAGVYNTEFVFTPKEAYKEEYEPLAITVKVFVSGSYSSNRLDIDDIDNIPTSLIKTTDANPAAVLLGTNTGSMQFEVLQGSENVRITNGKIVEGVRNGGFVCHGWTNSVTHADQYLIFSGNVSGFDNDPTYPKSLRPVIKTQPEPISIPIYTKYKLAMDMIPGVEYTATVDREDVLSFDKQTQTITTGDVVTSGTENNVATIEFYPILNDYYGDVTRLQVITTPERSPFIAMDVNTIRTRPGSVIPLNIEPLNNSTLLVENNYKDFLYFDEKAKAIKTSNLLKGKGEIIFSAIKGTEFSRSLTLNIENEDIIKPSITVHNLDKNVDLPIGIERPIEISTYPEFLQFSCKSSNPDIAYFNTKTNKLVVKDIDENIGSNLTLEFYSVLNGTLSDPYIVNVNVIELTDAQRPSVSITPEAPLEVISGRRAAIQINTVENATIEYESTDINRLAFDIARSEVVTAREIEGEETLTFMVTSETGLKSRPLVYPVNIVWDPSIIRIEYVRPDGPLNVPVGTRPTIFVGVSPGCYWNFSSSNRNLLNLDMRSGELTISNKPGMTASLTFTAIKGNQRSKPFVYTVNTVESPTGPTMSVDSGYTMNIPAGTNAEIAITKTEDSTIECESRNRDIAVYENNTGRIVVGNTVGSSTTLSFRVLKDNIYSRAHDVTINVVQGEQNESN